MPAPLTTIVSTKGLAILPKSIRGRRDWDAGTKLVVEDTPDGVLLRQAPAFPPTRPENDTFAHSQGTLEGILTDLEWGEQLFAAGRGAAHYARAMCAS